MDLDSLKYPIGKFSPQGAITMEQIQQWISEIQLLPEKLRNAVAGLTDEQLNTPYRPEGWTLRQVVHHVADSHMNSYCRFKLALTEDQPTIRPYFEDRWAELVDGKDTPIEVSLRLLESLHERWVILLQSLTEEDWKRAFYHPENEVFVGLGYNAGLYAWHGLHHTAHITSLKERMGW